jgi:hypothetical protein
MVGRNGYKFLEYIIPKKLKIHGIVRTWIPIIEARIGFRSYEYSS